MTGGLKGREGERQEPRTGGPKGREGGPEKPREERERERERERQTDRQTSSVAVFAQDSEHIARVNKPGQRDRETIMSSKEAMAEEIRRLRERRSEHWKPWTSRLSEKQIVQTLS